MKRKSNIDDGFFLSQNQISIWWTITPKNANSTISATIHPDLKRTLVVMSERTGMSISQVTDEVLYTGLVEMQELWREVWDGF